MAEIRATQVAGLITDIGIEIGKLFYWNRRRENGAQFFVMANRSKLRVHVLLVVSFFSGGIVGALGFKHVGFVSTIPLAIGLVVLSFTQLFKPEH